MIINPIDMDPKKAIDDNNLKVMNIKIKKYRINLGFWHCNICKGKAKNNLDERNNKLY